MPVSRDTNTHAKISRGCPWVGTSRPAPSGGLVLSWFSVLILFIPLKAKLLAGDPVVGLVFSWFSWFSWFSVLFFVYSTKS